MNNEAYASQYMDHHIARHPRLGTVLMSRQNLSQGGAYPWAAHGCLDGEAGFATDFRQVMGPGGRDRDGPQPAVRRKPAVGAAPVRNGLRGAAVARRRRLRRGRRRPGPSSAPISPTHPAASSDADLAIVDAVERAARDFAPTAVSSEPIRSAPCFTSAPCRRRRSRWTTRPSPARYRRRTHVERAEGDLLSFFTPGRTHSRHIVTRDKERIVARRHGALCAAAIR